MTRDEAVREVVRVIVSHFRPERIYLIGSTARGEARPDSDLDFVVVLPDNAPRAAVIGEGIHRLLWDIPFAVDVVPFRHSTFEARAPWLLSLPAIALREGRLEYEAQLPA